MAFMKTKIDVKKIEKEECTVNCPFCDNKIKGTSKKHVISNLEMHLNMRHREEKSTEILAELRGDIKDD